MRKVWGVLACAKLLSCKVCVNPAQVLVEVESAGVLRCSQNGWQVFENRIDREGAVSPRDQAGPN